MDFYIDNLFKNVIKRLKKFHKSWKKAHPVFKFKDSLEKTRIMYNPVLYKWHSDERWDIFQLQGKDKNGKVLARFITSKKAKKWGNPILLQ